MEAPRIVSSEFIAGATDESQLPAPALAEVAFAGRSNVGKSSLLNALMERKGLARSSNTPGCTRQINVFKIRFTDSLDVHLVDLPGYGFAQRSKAEKGVWGAMLEGYLRRRVSLRAVVVLVDIRRGIEPDDLQLVDFLNHPREINENKPLSTIIVATKLDKLALSARKPAMTKLRKESGIAVLGCSAETGDGIAQLWLQLRAALI